MIKLSVIIIILAFDRFFLKRRKIRIRSTKKIQDSNAVRFILAFDCQKSNSNATLIYSIRSKENPKAVIVKSRKLDFSDKGLNEEFLVFSKNQISAQLGKESIAGEWILDIKIESAHSKINPLYKIFPLIHSQQKEVFRLA